VQTTLRFFLFVGLIGSIQLSFGQVSSPRERPDVSNKALITKTAPPITTESKASTADSAALHKLADEYYNWRNENYPVASSEAGLHTWDNRLTDYSAAKVAERAQRTPFVTCQNKRSALLFGSAFSSNSWNRRRISASVSATL